jgi:SAM-dependent methyltransferase
MKKSFESKYHLLEKNYWWFRARRDIILRILRDDNKKSNILDVGCSGGLLLEDLKSKKYKNVTGIDKSQSAVDICKKKGLSVFKMDAMKTKFKKKTFDIVIASDILEHTKDDAAAVAEWTRILKKGGKLIIFVPAYQFLWSAHDESNMHNKRYIKKEIVELMKKSGLTVKKKSYWNSILCIPVVIMRFFNKMVLKQIKQKDDLVLSSKFINNVLFSILKLENIWLNIFNLPFGVSVYCIGIKTVANK